MFGKVTDLIVEEQKLPEEVFEVRFQLIGLDDAYQRKGEMRDESTQ